MKECGLKLTILEEVEEVVRERRENFLITCIYSKKERIDRWHFLTFEVFSKSTRNFGSLFETFLDCFLNLKYVDADDKTRDFDRFWQS